MYRSKEKEAVFCAKSLILTLEKNNIFLSIGVLIAFHNIWLSYVIQNTCAYIRLIEA